MNPILLTDFYKTGHVFQYPAGTSLVYSNLTARSSRLPGVRRAVFFGAQYFVQKILVDAFDQEFFGNDEEQLLSEYRTFTGVRDVSHIQSLLRLGFLPIEIRALPEGSHVPLRVPMMTIRNTRPEFAWLTNYIETVLSSCIWAPITSATIAGEYRKIIDRHALLTGTDPGFADYMAHDFSMRGMGGLDAAIASGMAHLVFFRGTDTVPANVGLAEYYDAHRSDFGGSVPATEHSVMCAGGEENETETFRRLIEDVYPEGIVSIVSDTWDLFGGVIGRALPALREKILRRDGKVVIRPDSGDPVRILCGDPEAPAGSPERAGVVEALYSLFGGTETPTGHRLLDPHIGTIYGDSITLARAEEILSRLAEKGFAAGNVVFGVGSYTYQYVTRDTLGLAIKSTAVEIDGVPRAIYKRPKTDDGTKNSARGFLRVERREDGELALVDGQRSLEDAEGGELRTIFRDGEMQNREPIRSIRWRAMEGLR